MTRSSRFSLDKIYGQIELNDVKLDQIEIHTLWDNNPIIQDFYDQNDQLMGMK